MQAIQQADLPIEANLELITETNELVTTNKKNSKCWCGYFVIDKTRVVLFTTTSCIAGLASSAWVINIYSRKVDNCVNIDPNLFLGINWLNALLPSVIYNFFYAVITTNDANIRLSESNEFAVVRVNQDVEANAVMSIGKQKQVNKATVNYFGKKIIKSLQATKEKIQNIANGDALAYGVTSFALVIIMTPILDATNGKEAHCESAGSPAVMSFLINAIISLGLYCVVFLAKKCRNPVAENDS